MTLGGVGRNLAAAIEFLGHQPTFLTSLANDNLGAFARLEMNKLGLSSGQEPTLEGDRWPRMQVLTTDDLQSSCFALVLIDSITGQCEYVIANLDATSAISRQNLDKLTSLGCAPGRTLEQQLQTTPLVVLDANLSGETIDHLVKLCAKHRVPIFLEPTDVVCLARLVYCLKRVQPIDSLNSLAFLSPNVVELEELTRLFEGPVNKTNSQSEHYVGQMEQIARRLMELHMPHLRCLLVTMDKRGVLVMARLSDNNLDKARLLEQEHVRGLKIVCKHYTPERVIERPVSASGAGDCFAAGFISGLIDGLPLDACVQLAFKASACALQDRSPVPATLGNLVATDPQGW